MQERIRRDNNKSNLVMNYQYLFSLGTWKSWLLCSIVIVLIVSFLSNKLVRNEYKEIFCVTLQIRSKRRFILSLILLTIFICVLVKFLCVFVGLGNDASFCSNDASFWLSCLGLCSTAFFGVIIVLKTSTNNIGKLLSRVSDMFMTTNELYIILPTPFLGYLSYRRHYKKIEQYLIKNTQTAKFNIAFLDWEKNTPSSTKTTPSTIEEWLNNEYEAQKEHYKEIRGISRRLSRGKEENFKKGAWEKFLEENQNNRGWLPDLFQFHFDDIREVKISNEKKFDYFIALCKYINTIVNNPNHQIQVKKINITYDFDETVFPVILINSCEKKILHGTTRVESQLKVRFEGDTITDGKLCGKANDIFNAYIS